VRRYAVRSVASAGGSAMAPVAVVGSAQSGRDNPVIAEIVQRYKAKYPAASIRVNVIRTASNGNPTELDIVTDNAIVEVKTTNAGLARQVTARIADPALNGGRAVIGFSTRLKDSTAAVINSRGGIAAGAPPGSSADALSDAIDVLVDVLRP
jgi:hypothetical protein